jgi:coenzyme F420-reducing hydrogenase beta subunit
MQAGYSAARISGIADSSICTSPEERQVTLILLASLDFSAEHADIAVGDPWLKGRDGKLLFTDNRTTVLVRTDIGDQVIRMAEAEGYIKLEQIDLKTYMVNFEGGARYKRSFLPKNILLRRLVGKPVPKYHRPALWNLESSRTSYLC